MNKVKSMQEINSEAIEILSEELGVANTIRFINQYHKGLGNYTEERSKKFKNHSIDDILSEIEECREDPKKTNN